MTSIPLIEHIAHEAFIRRAAELAMPFMLKGRRRRFDEVLMLLLDAIRKI